VAPLYRALPFSLTAAQTRAIAEIFADMAAGRRMNRLLQGDVGSGKTIVALFAMLLAVESGYQAALMAPTEILAEQHARTLRALLEPLQAAGRRAGLEGIEGLAGVDPGGVSLTLLTGRLGAAARREAQDAVAAGAAQLVVGTHALIQESVSFQRLGLAIADEQHRFGVRQRLALAEQGRNIDVLVMSATPIPRSLALTMYGDLDLSVLDELPPGRQRVRTAVRSAERRHRVYEFIRGQVALGRQAYIVYPLVEESDKVELRAAAAEYERLAGDVFPELRLGLLHGQLHGETRDAVMAAFAAGELDILVATTVIEVGIDVPNATVMVVEHAERFGLSQLHQLRGRVGRGGEQSYCILVADTWASRRLEVLASSNDGFEIARADLAIRGMGDFFGARQHGLPEFRYFDPLRDDDLVLRARAAAQQITDADPLLGRPEHAGLRTTLDTRFASRAALYDVG
jgi:ATP-dependent DNA helicase RecG